MEAKQKPVYESVDELALELGMSRKRTYDFLNSGDIPAIRLGRRFVVPRSAVQRWLESAGQLTPR
jgi:excisionase family DNA binding protein